MSAGILRQLARMSPQEVNQLFKASKHVMKRERLIRQAKELRKKLTRLDRQIARLDARIGTDGTTPRKAQGSTRTGHRRKRFDNKEPLKDVLVGVMKNAEKPTRVVDLAALALKAGYKTSSKPAFFMRAVHQALNKGSEFARKGRGLYALK